MTTVNAAIAANRFGLGARPGELSRLASDPRGWLTAQLKSGARPLPAFAQLKSSREITAALQRFIMERRAARRAEEDEAMLGDEADLDRTGSFSAQFLPIYRAEALARTWAAVGSDAPLCERLVHFWSNHFTVSIQKNSLVPLAGAFEREAIRPHVNGRFLDMLLAVEKHPAMLIYLDNIRSMGPASRAAARTRRTRLGLNENLAREILELHTVGADGGFSQADVTAFAKILTGWTVANARRRGGEAGTFVFAAKMHEPGDQTVLGRRYAQAGVEQGEAVLRDLTRAPATARYIATKLARHFIADTPPAAAVEHIARTFADTDGDLAAVTRALIATPEAWRRPLDKFKTPNEFILSGLRALSVEDVPDDVVLGTLTVMGQRPFAAPSPQGWPDTAAEWAGPDAVLRRIEWSMAVGERTGMRARPLSVAESALGPLLGVNTRQVIRSAASRGQGLALLLSSPEFQRR